MKDTIPPVAIANNITIQLDANGQASITAEQINNGSTDNVKVSNYSLDKTTFDCHNVGDNTVTLTVTDSTGNASTATAIVRVEDKAAPVVITKNISVILTGGNAAITASDINNESYDNCSIDSLWVSKTSFDCSNIGKNNVTLNINDVFGNVSSASAIVTVIGQSPDADITVSRTDNTFTGLDSKTIALGYGAQSLTLMASHNSSVAGATKYVWSPSSWLSNPNVANTVFTPPTSGTYNFTVTATNEYGCPGIVSVAITVIDVRCGNNNHKVLLCHKTGSSNNPYTQLCISPNAVDAHLRKGSSLGNCSTLPLVNAESVNQYNLNEKLNGNETWVVFPNPYQSGSLNISGDLIYDKNVSCSLMNVTGQLVSITMERVSSGLLTLIPSGKLAPGIYLLIVKGSTGVVSKQIIVTE